MKCESCLQLLEEYVDGELKGSEMAALSEHLVRCFACASELEILSSEQELYARYDRELTIKPSLWNEVAARTIATGLIVEPQPSFGPLAWLAIPNWGWTFAGASALLLVFVAFGVIYFHAGQPTVQQVNNLKSSQVTKEQRNGPPAIDAIPASMTMKKDESQANMSSIPSKVSRTSRTAAAAVSTTHQTVIEPADVLFSEIAYAAAEEKETQTHIENAQNLLRSVRNLKISDDDPELDVSYERAMSRRLLNENIVLRREAEMSGKFPMKDLLTDLEPFLLDIANLPDKPAAEDLRVLKERVFKTEIVAALQSY